jgi:hypothetical protein
MWAPRLRKRVVLFDFGLIARLSAKIDIVSRAGVTYARPAFGATGMEESKCLKARIVSLVPSLPVLAWWSLLVIVANPPLISSSTLR